MASLCHWSMIHNHPFHIRLQFSCKSRHWEVPCPSCKHPPVPSMEAAGVELGKGHTGTGAQFLTCWVQQREHKNVSFLVKTSEAPHSSSTSYEAASTAVPMWRITSIWQKKPSLQARYTLRINSWEEEGETSRQGCQLCLSCNTGNFPLKPAVQSLIIT